jgi:RNA polymerase sigma-70 factor (ECF subfamily)
MTLAMTFALTIPAVAADVEDERALAALLARVAGGDLDALGGIYDAMATKIFAAAHWRTGSRADAADCVQEVFVKLATSPQVAARIEHPRRYLLAMAHRAAVDRTRARRREAPLDGSPLLESGALDPERALEAAQATSLLRMLPDAQREAIYLHEFVGLSFRDVGRVTGVPTFTAASRHRLGIAKLRALMGADR